MKKAILTLIAGLLIAGAANASITISFEDLTNAAINDLNVGGSTDYLTVSRTLSDGIYTFSVTYAGLDFDGDSVFDTLSYDILVAGMSGNTVTTSLTTTGTSGTSGEVILDGESASVGAAINSNFKTFGVGNDMASGETLIFTVENISVDVDGYTGSFDGFSSFVAQSSGSSEALTVVGSGTGLQEVYTATNASFTDLSSSTLYVSSANPSASDAWGVRYLDYSITVVPESGSYALFASLLSLGWVIARRRQV
jgi:hypothetical protein